MRVICGVKIILTGVKWTNFQNPVSTQNSMKFFERQGFEPCIFAPEQRGAKPRCPEMTALFEAIQNLSPLLAAQAFHRVCQRRLHALETHRQKRHRY
jgi:hypothetical protein